MIIHNNIYNIYIIYQYNYKYNKYNIIIYIYINYIYIYYIYIYIYIYIVKSPNFRLFISIAKTQLYCSLIIIGL